MFKDSKYSNHAQRKNKRSKTNLYSMILGKVNIIEDLKLIYIVSMLLGKVNTIEDLKPIYIVSIFFVKVNIIEAYGIFEIYRSRFT